MKKAQEIAMPLDSVRDACMHATLLLLIGGLVGGVLIDAGFGASLVFEIEIAQLTAYIITRPKTSVVIVQHTQPSSPRKGSSWGRSCPYTLSD